MPSRRGRIVLFALIALTVASLWRTASVERQKREVAQAYQEAQEMVEQLEMEKARLSGELGSASQKIAGQAADIESLQTALTQFQDRLDETVAELASLQREHEQVRGRNASLVAQLESVTSEKQQLEARLSSLNELRLAIRDVKRKVWQERWAAWYARIEAQQQQDQEALALGNRGFVIRQGTSTVGSAPARLHVHVLEPQSQ